MVGGYVIFKMPASVVSPSFVSGTAFPGIYERINSALETGKLPVCHLDGVLDIGESVSPFASNILKLQSGSFSLSAFGKTLVIGADDSVIVN